jgi:uncharacterized protein DUF3850
MRELKCDPGPFELMWLGLKPFEVRADDGNFGTTITVLRLREWDRERVRERWDLPEAKQTPPADLGYTGREVIAVILSKLFTWETPEHWRIRAPGIVVMGLSVRMRIDRGRRLDP